VQTALSLDFSNLGYRTILTQWAWTNAELNEINKLNDGKVLLFKTANKSVLKFFNVK